MSDPTQHLTLVEHLLHLSSLHAQFLAAGFASLVFVVLGVKVSAYYARKGDAAVTPSEKVTLINLVEWAIEKLDGLAASVIGEKEGRKFTPLLATLFLFIFLMNLLGNIPGLPAATANINVNFGMGLFVFLAYNYLGFKEHGMKYLKHFMGPIWWLAPLMFAIEVISHLVRPASLSIRLFGNINGDHIAVNAFQSLTHVVVPVAFMGLGLFVAFIQALVFTILTAVYIQMAIAHEDH